MILVFQIICFLEAIGLVLAIRDMRRLQREVAKQQAKRAELQSRNAQLFMAAEESKESAAIVQGWYQQLFENTRDMVLVHGVTAGKEPGKLMEANRIACETLGYAPGELREKTLLDIEEVDVPASAWASQNENGALTEEYIGKWIDRASNDSARQRVAQVMETGQLVCDRMFRAKNGKKIPVEIHAQRLFLDGKPSVMLTAKDRTQREEHEQARRASESQLEAFFDRSPFGMAMYGNKLELLKTNTACLGMFGFPDQEQLQRFNLFANPYVPGDVQMRVIRGETVRYEAVVDFKEAVEKSLCVTSRKDKGWFVIVMSNMGSEGSRMKGYFAEIKDITQQRKLEEDLRRLHDSTSAREGITGSLEDVALTDLMQIICAGGRSMQIDLATGKKRASVTIQEGTIIHCEVGSKQGDEAFYDLMRWKSGDFSAKTCSTFPKRTIQASLMSLLMEGARQADEAGETA